MKDKLFYNNKEEIRHYIDRINNETNYAIPVVIPVDDGYEIKCMTPYDFVEWAKKELGENVENLKEMINLEKENINKMTKSLKVKEDRLKEMEGK